MFCSCVVNGVVTDSLDRMNVEFQKAGARGISLLYAAGDEGANCESDVYVPETPGSSPFVTAVGGTTGAEKEVGVLRRMIRPVQ